VPSAKGPPLVYTPIPTPEPLAGVPTGTPSEADLAEGDSAVKTLGLSAKEDEAHPHLSSPVAEESTGTFELPPEYSWPPQTRPPSRPPEQAANWKSTTPSRNKVRKQRRVLVPVRIALLLGALAAIGFAGVWAVKRSGEAASHVRGLMLQGNYTAAYDVLDAPALRLFLRKPALLREVQDAQAAVAQRLYEEGKRDEAEKVCREILARYDRHETTSTLVDRIEKDREREVAEARRLRFDAVRAQVSGLLGQGKYPDALKAIEEKQAELSDHTQELRQLVQREWLARLQELARAGRKEEARGGVTALLDSFPGDADALALRDRLNYVPPDPRKVDELLARVKPLLASDKPVDFEDALRHCEEALRQREIQSLVAQRGRAEQGRVRALARLGRWQDVKQGLMNLPTAEPADRALKGTLSVLVEEQQETPPDAAATLAKLSQFRDGLEPGWESDRLRELEQALDKLVKGEKLVATGTDAEKQEAADAVGQWVHDHPTALRKGALDALGQRIRGSIKTEFDRLYAAAERAYEDARGKGTFAEAWKAYELAESRVPKGERAQNQLKDLKARLANADPKTVIEEANLARLQALKTGGSFARARGAYEVAVRRASPDEATQSRLKALQALIEAQDPKGDSNKAFGLLHGLLTGPSLPPDVNAAELIDALADLAGTPPRPEYRGKVQQLLQAVKPRYAQVDPYLLYFQAWNDFGEGRLEQAANSLCALIPEAGANAPLFQSAVRRRRVLELFQQVCRDLRRDQLGSPFKQPEAPAKVYGWLRKAGRLESELPAPLRVDLALAAWHKGDAAGMQGSERRDAELARQLSAALVTDPALEQQGPWDQALVLLVHGASHAARGDLKSRTAAVQSFVKAWEVLEKSAGKGPAPRELEEATLAKAIELDSPGKPATDPAVVEFRKQLARAYAARGRFVRAYPEDFGKNPRNLVFESYGRAAELDPGREDYAADRFVAHYLLPEATSAQLLEEANGLRRAGCKEPRVYHICGKLYFEQFEHNPPKKPDLDALRKAVKAYGEGIALYDRGRREDEHLAELLQSSSAANLSLGNALDDGHHEPSAEEEQALYLARDQAERATRIGGGGPSEYSLTALGNALEDIAFILRRDPDKHYALAEKAFHEATVAKDIYAKSWTDLGRCRYRWVNYLTGKIPAAQKKERLDNAMAALERAVRLEPQSREAAEALKWQAQIHWMREDYEQADKTFRKAVELAESYDPRSRKIYLKEWAACSLEAATWSKLEAFRKTALKTCRQLAESLLKEEPGNVSAALVLGDSYRLAGQEDFVQAFEAYGRVLPKDPARADLSHLQPVMRRVDLLLLPKAREALGKDPKAAVAMADQAVELAKGLSNPIEGQAFGQAGLMRCVAAIRLVEKKDEATVNRYRKEAIRLLEQALLLAPADGDAYVWRYSIARQLWYFRDGSDRAAVKKQAVEQLQKALQQLDGKTGGGAASYRRDVQQLLESWNKIP
jgi:tetratricopeptide (TPR) repeat protein